MLLLCSPCCSSSFKAKDVGGGLTLKELLALASTGGVYVNVSTPACSGPMPCIQSAFVM